MSNTLFDIPETPKVRHPAKYSDALLPVFIRMLRGSKRILAMWFYFRTLYIFQQPYRFPR